jgi:hypothetical protein
MVRDYVDLKSLTTDSASLAASQQIAFGNRPQRDNHGAHAQSHHIEPEGVRSPSAFHRPSVWTGRDAFAAMGTKQ